MAGSGTRSVSTQALGGEIQHQGIEGDSSSYLSRAVNRGRCSDLGTRTANLLKVLPGSGIHSPTSRAVRIQFRTATRVFSTASGIVVSLAIYAGRLQ